MLPFKTIICPVSFTLEPRRAITMATDLARRSGGAKIIAPNVVSALRAVPATGIPAVSHAPEPIADAGAALGRFLGRVCPDADVHPVVQLGDPASTILEIAEQADADLIVMATRARSGVGRVLLGSVAEAVMRGAPMPVIAVPEDADGEAAEPASFAPEKILAAVDLSSFARLVVENALALARAHDAELHLVHVVDTRGSSAIEALLTDYQPSLRSLIELARSRADGLMEVALAEVDDFDPGRLHRHLLVGHPAREIAELASSLTPDLLVIGSRGRSGLGEHLMGSTAERALRAAPCPVLAVGATDDEIERLGPPPELRLAPSESFEVDRDDDELEPVGSLGGRWRDAAHRERADRIWPPRGWPGTGG